MPEPLAISVNDAALALSISPWTLRKWIAKGVLPAIHLGRRVLVEPSALTELIEESRRRGV
jgi:excisionase family DNA binding protein